MGTRADFYIGRGTDARWLGSCAYDGWAEALEAVCAAKSDKEYVEAVAQRLMEPDGTHPVQGWPWPWDDSHTTDFAYAWDEGAVHVSMFGGTWLSAEQVLEREAAEVIEDWPEGPEPIFPDMKARQAVTYGPRSGLIVLGLAEKKA